MRPLSEIGAGALSGGLVGTGLGASVGGPIGAVAGGITGAVGGSIAGAFMPTPDGNNSNSNQSNNRMGIDIQRYNSDQSYKAGIDDLASQSQSKISQNGASNNNAYNPVNYSGGDQAIQMAGLGAYTQNRTQDQAGWQQGQQLAYNDALNRQNQLATQQYGQTANAAANANQQRALVGATAQTLNNVYGNSMQQMNQAAANSQNTFASLANTAAGMFR
jgi:hypothetical protein